LEEFLKKANIFIALGRIKLYNHGKERR